MMEHDAVTQTMYIAALGTEYTFKAAGASAKIIMSLLKAISEKVKLTTADKKLLRLASDDVATAVTIKETDLKNFKAYAKDFGLTYIVVGNKHQVETGLLDVIVRQDQLTRVNEFLNRIGYGKVVEDTAKKGSPSISESIEPTHELGNSTGIELPTNIPPAMTSNEFVRYLHATMSPDMFKQHLLHDPKGTYERYLQPTVPPEVFEQYLRVDRAADRNMLAQEALSTCDSQVDYAKWKEALDEAAEADEELRSEAARFVDMREQYLQHDPKEMDERTKDNPLVQDFVEGDLTGGNKDYKTDTSTASERLEPPDLERINLEIKEAKENLGVVAKKGSYIDTIIDNAVDTASHQNAERFEKVAEKVSAVAEKIETVLEAK